jgi:WD40 repeat protein
VSEAPSKAIPVSNSELERIQREFKFHSPVPGSPKRASPPKEGEEWKLDRTLPSGLLVSNRRQPKWWQAIFNMEPEVEEEDVRQLQYDIEKHHKENPNLFVQIRGTSSVAWHPTEKRLVTAGDGIVAKLWDTETGELVTRYPFYSTSPGHSISWSDDGAIFTVDHYLFDGATGECLGGPNGYRFVLGPGSYAYTPHAYGKLRVVPNHYFHSTASTNFTPFRPNSNHYVLRDIETFNASKSAINPWKPRPDQYDRCLVLRNRRTGEVEKIIDCAASPGIEDFAWHPRGRFIAVAFKEDNVRIIDIDEVRTVDSLSVPHLVGWAPTGRILVLRKTISPNDLVIWDALQTQEKPFPEEIRNEIWFKRFSSNISADGLRYIKGVQIHSTDSDEIIARLPIEHVQTAAWSPIDGGLLATSGSSINDSYINEISRFAVSPEGRSQSQTHIWRL